MSEEWCWVRRSGERETPVKSGGRMEGEAQGRRSANGRDFAEKGTTAKAHLTAHPTNTHCIRTPTRLSGCWFQLAPPTHNSLAEGGVWGPGAETDLTVHRSGGGK